LSASASGLSNGSMIVIEPQVSNLLVTALMSLTTIKCLDMSKNKFHLATLNYLFQALPSLLNLQTLSLSQVGISDENVPAFI
jgi:Ran GTPase-activating protein (RanGAP) involved in mRNA processing and transport